MSSRTGPLPHEDWNTAVRRVKLAAVRAKIDHLSPMSYHTTKRLRKAIGL